MAIKATKSLTAGMKVLGGANIPTYTLEYLTETRSKKQGNFETIIVPMASAVNPLPKNLKQGGKDKILATFVMLITLSFLLVMFVPDTVSAQRSEIHTATLPFASGSPDQNGYADASIQMRYAFINCLGQPNIQYSFVPTTLTTGNGYWFEGELVSIPAGSPTPQLSTVHFSGSVLRQQGGETVSVGTFVDGLTISRELAGCAGQSQAVRYHGGYQSPQGLNTDQWQEYLNSLSIRVDEAPALTSGSVESAIRAERDQARRDSLAAARTDSIATAQAEAERAERERRGQEAAAQELARWEQRIDARREQRAQEARRAAEAQRIAEAEARAREAQRAREAAERERQAEAAAQAREAQRAREAAERQREVNRGSQSPASFCSSPDSPSEVCIVITWDPTTPGRESFRSRLAVPYRIDPHRSRVRVSIDAENRESPLVPGVVMHAGEGWNTFVVPPQEGVTTLAIRVWPRAAATQDIRIEIFRGGRSVFQRTPPVLRDRNLAMNVFSFDRTHYRFDTQQSHLGDLPERLYSLERGGPVGWRSASRSIPIRVPWP